MAGRSPEPEYSRENTSRRRVEVPPQGSFLASVRVVDDVRYIRGVLAAGALVFAAVVIHNACGYGLGYLAGMLTKQPIAARRTMAVEVGMQNSGLATSLHSFSISLLKALAVASAQSFEPTG